jgi:hypothetical protein
MYFISRSFPLDRSLGRRADGCLDRLTDLTFTVQFLGGTEDHRCLKRDRIRRIRAKDVCYGESGAGGLWESCGR